MKLHRLFGLTLIALLILSACGGGGGEAASSDSDGGGGDAAVESPVDAATAGTINGKISFTGTAPEPQAILMDAEPDCDAQYSDGAFTEEVVVNSNGTLMNVFVHVTDGLGDLVFPVPSESVLLDQQGCRYEPHVLGVQTGQDLTIRNSDGILHNIHPMPENNRPFNLGQPIEMDSTKSFPTSEVMIPVECDVHDWMVGYIGVKEHPYFDVTGSDGAFSLPNLPPGTYTVEAWHELYGTQSMSVTVGESETVDIELTFAG